MSTLLFDHATQKLTVTWASGEEESWDAANNVDSHSEGPWPDGTYQFVAHMTHPDDAPESEYGSYGGLLFNVPGRSGMEIHSGREETPDGCNRYGFEHCTMGCIRTVDSAMETLVQLLQSDPPTTLTVQ